MADFDANAVGAANVEAVSVFKTPPAVLSESLFFLCAEQREVTESWILINEDPVDFTSMASENPRFCQMALK